MHWALHEFLLEAGRREEAELQVEDDVEEEEAADGVENGADEVQLSSSPLDQPQQEQQQQQQQQQL